MVIPIDQDGRTQTDHNEVFWKTINSRIAGGAHTGVVEPRQVSPYKRLWNLLFDFPTFCSLHLHLFFLF